MGQVHGALAALPYLRQELEEAGVPISVTEIMPSSMNTPLFETAPSREGVQSKGQPPLYEPEVTVKAVVHAAEQPVRTLIIGGGDRLLIAMKALAPRFADWYLRRTAFAGQRTDIPKSGNAPGNHYQLVAGTVRAHGRNGGPASARSTYTTLETNPRVQSLLAGAGLLALRAATRRRRLPDGEGKTRC